MAVGRARFEAIITVLIEDHGAWPLKDAINLVSGSLGGASSTYRQHADALSSSAGPWELTREGQGAWVITIRDMGPAKFSTDSAKVKFTDLREPGLVTMDDLRERLRASFGENIETLEPEGTDIDSIIDRLTGGEP